MAPNATPPNKLLTDRGRNADACSKINATLDEGPAAFARCPIARAARDVYPRLHGRHRGSVGGKPSRAFLESATKPWLMSLRGQGNMPCKPSLTRSHSARQRQH